MVDYITVDVTGSDGAVIHTMTIPVDADDPTEDGLAEKVKNLIVERFELELVQEPEPEEKT